MLMDGDKVKDQADKNHQCCGRGGARPGCGRKPGVKTKPVRLPEWLLEALEEVGEPRHAIVKACMAQYGIEHPRHRDSHE